MCQVGADEIDNHHPNIGPCLCQSAPMPTPAAADIQYKRAGVELPQEKIDLMIHNWHGMAARNGLEVVRVAS
jgi:hypothetical protein